MIKVCDPFRACRAVLRLRHLKPPEQQYALKGNFSNGFSGMYQSNSSHTTNGAETYVMGSAGMIWLEFFSICFLGTLFVFVGLLGNIFNIIILSRSRVGKDSTNVLLLFLAVMDILVLVTHFGQFTPCFTCYMDKARMITVDTYFILYSPVHSIMSCSLSVDTTGLIALERATAVFFPFRVSSIFTKKTVKMILLVMTLVIMPFYLPADIGIRVIWRFDRVVNDTVANGFYFIFNWDLFLEVLKWAENVTLTVGMSMVFVFGSATAIKLIHQSKNRKQMTSNLSSSSSAKDRKVVKMLLVLCLFSFVGNIPNIAVNYITAYYSVELIKMGWYCFIRGTVLLIIVINSSVNFFIYFFMSAKFKKACKEMLNVLKFPKLLH